MGSVLVFGSINMDVVTMCERLPRMGETVLGESVAFHPGGKGANQAIAAARCLGQSILIGSVGADDFGRRMVSYLGENGVDVSGLRMESEAPTGLAVITVDAQGENTIVVTPGANGFAKAPLLLPPSSEAPVIALAQLESPIAEITRFFAMVRAANGMTILNPSPYQPLPRDLLRETSVIILNDQEFAALTCRAEAADARQIMNILEAQTLTLPSCIVTLGAAGAIVWDETHTPVRIEGHKVPTLDTTGAGDCFAGWFAAEVVSGRSFADAAKRANAAAAISVTRAGAASSMPRPSEVDDFLAG